jgi:hypothetical protein
MINAIRTIIFSIFLFAATEKGVVPQNQREAGALSQEATITIKKWFSKITRG